MRGGIAHLIGAFAAMIATGNGMASTANNKLPPGECRVVGGSKLSPDLNKALCAEVTRAVAAAAPGSRFSVEVTAISPSRLAADIAIDGKALPQQNFAVMDAELDLASIRQFAQSLGEIARGAKR